MKTKRLKKFLQPKLFAPIIVFLVLYLLHFWLLFSGSTLYGGPGDHTAGLIWLYDQYPHSPWWQSTNHAAYPWGEDLWSPLFITGQIGYILFWLASRIVDDPVAGYNILTSVGFILSFIVAYLFILKRVMWGPWIAALMAAAITFTPMALYLNGVGHFAYLYCPAYLIGCIWLILSILDKRSVWKAVCLGLLIGSVIVFDPYFVLFIPFAAVLFSLTLLILGYIKFSHITAYTKELIVAVVACLLIVVPTILFIQRSSEEVNRISANTRGAQLFDANQYSARIKDYILPAAENPFVPKAIKEVKQNSYHGTDRTFTLYLGWVVIVGFIISFVLFVRRMYKKRTKEMAIAGALLVVAVGAFIFSLPPVIQVFSFELYTPTWIVATLTPTWRVFARFFFIVQPAIILFIAYILRAHSEALNAKKAHILTIILASGLVFTVFIDYLPRNPFDTRNFWNYMEKLPSAYRELKTIGGTLAEYPIREQPYFRGSMYVAGQYIHNLPTLNSYSPTSPTILERTSLMDLNNPQTIPALQYLGINSLVVWNNQYQTWRQTKGVELKSSELFSSQFGKNEKIDLYKIQSQTSQRYIAGYLQTYRPLEDRQIFDINIPIESGNSLTVIDLCEKNTNKKCETGPDTHLLKFTITNTTSDATTFSLVDERGKEVATFTLTAGKHALEVAVPVGQYEMKFNKVYNSKLILFQPHVAIKESE